MKKTRIKRKIKLIISLIFFALLVQSCTATKKDCRGKTKHRLPNGIYM